MRMLEKRSLAALGAAAAIGMATASPACGQAKTIRFVPQSEATIFDPVVSVIAVTQQHAYMIYDNLFSLDEKGVPRPQMVGSHTLDATGRVHTMTLRSGLKFHDGTPVRAADAVASIRRWAARDLVGGKLVQLGLKVEIVDEQSFTVATAEPTALVLEAFAKPTSSALFVMREKDALNEPTRPVTDNIGSGPFRFVRSEHLSGSRLVYERNPDYVPRDEPASYFAGGKRVNVDRVEFRILPDSGSAVAALGAGEIDVYEAPPLDLLPVLRANPQIATRVLNRTGIMGVLRPNHLHPPFNNPKARQALFAMIDQREYLSVAGGSDSSNWRECYSFLGCNVPNETEAGTEIYRKPNIELAKQLLKESGYAGEPVLVMLPADQALVRGLTEVSIENLRKVGFNVDVLTIDWATMLQRRARQDPPQQGGWSIFHTWTFPFEIASPVVNFFLAAPCQGRGWFGWPCDLEHEKLRDAWASESDAAKRAAIYQQIQLRASQTVPFVPLGQWYAPVAMRRSISGLVDTPVTVFWNVQKAN